MPAVRASQPCESVRQDAAAEVASEVALHPGRDAPAHGVGFLRLGEEGLQVMLNHRVQERIAQRHRGDADPRVSACAPARSLGAERSKVLAMVLADGGRLLGMGIGLGLVGSMLVARSLEGLLFGVAPTDPLTPASVSLVMLAVGLGACAMPARRAAAVDPLVAMRAE